MLLNIEHTTVYRYTRPVQFGMHRVLMRPLEGHDVQIRSSSLLIKPAHRIRWMHDIFGNSVALVDFKEPSTELRVESRLSVEQFNTNPFNFVLEPYAVELPFAYKPAEAPDVAPYLLRSFPQDDLAIQKWSRPFRGATQTGTLDFLTALNGSVPLSFTYIRREEAGVQSPAQTLASRAGSCRDFSVLLMETARYVGLAARFVSGYLCSSDSFTHQAASGATHAWAEIYLPGAGWTGFDPTCGVLAADSHARVAVARDPAQAVPVSGSFIGTSADYAGLDVTVIARAVKEVAPP
jgi:transglutaminase-like putative cysteine protease